MDHRFAAAEGERIDAALLEGKGGGDGHAAGQRRFIGGRFNDPGAGLGKASPSQGAARRSGHVQQAAAGPSQTRESSRSGCRRRKLAARNPPVPAALQGAQRFFGPLPRFSPCRGVARDWCDPLQSLLHGVDAITAREDQPVEVASSPRASSSGPHSSGGPITGPAGRAPGRRLARTVAGLRRADSRPWSPQWCGPVGVAATLRPWAQASSLMVARPAAAAGWLP